MNDNQTALILAGGIGSRLWPLSTAARPKQFLELFEGQSLLQKTHARLARLIAPERIFVSTNDRYASLVHEQLPALPPENVLLEPARRNTAPAIAVCCASIAARFPGSTIGIFASDHAIAKETAFEATARRAYQFAAANDRLVTIAIEPSEAETGFGYLELGEELEAGVVRLKRFVEKPDRARAEEFLRAGNYAWNASMFLWRLDYFAEVLRTAAPEIASLAPRFVAAPATERLSIYEEMPSISIDYAVMEKAPDVAAVRGDFGWSDVGSWSAVADFAGRSKGNVFALRSDELFVHAEGERPVAVVGFDDAIVVESAEGILVLNRRNAEGLSKLVDEIEASRRK